MVLQNNEYWISLILCGAEILCSQWELRTLGTLWRNGE